MKIVCGMWLLVLISSLSFLQAQNGHQIEVFIDGFTESEAYLAYYYGEKQYIKDTAEVVDGAFTFAGAESLDKGIYLVVLPPENQYFEILVSEDQTFSLETKMGDMPGNMEVIGDEENELFYADMHFIAKQRQQANALQSQLKSLPKDSPEANARQQELSAINDKVQGYRKQFIEEHPDFLYAKVLKALEEPQVPDPPKNADGSLVDSLFAFKYYRAHFFDHFDFTDDRLLRTPIFQQKVNQYMDNLTYKHPDSIAVAADYLIGKSRSNDDVYQYLVVHLLNKYANSKIMGMDAVYVHMVEKYYLSGEAWWSDDETLKKMEERARAISPTLINRQAPNFWAPDAKGKRQTLHEQEGLYTVLYFWDIDCGHCKKVTPKLSEAFRQYHDHNIRLMTVSINGDQADWEKRLEEYGLTGQPNTTHTHDPLRQSRFDGWYDLRSTPRLFLLDEEKKIVAKQISVFQMQEILNRALDLPAPERDEEEESGK